MAPDRNSNDDETVFNDTLYEEHSIYDHPTMLEYYSNLTPFVTLCIFISILLCVLNLSIFCTTTAKLKRRVTRSILRVSITLVSMYPIISIAAVVTLLVPKAWLACHTVMHISFTIAAIFFHRLCFLYVDSEASYIKETAGAAVAINTPPCCCCCACLPGMVPSKGKFVILRCMVWQMVFVQGSIMLVLNAIYYNDKLLYHDVVLYFLPFIICSIIIGIWGLNITVRTVNSVHGDYRLMKKLLSCQLILLLCKLQYLILHSQLDGLTLGGPYPINHTIYKQTVINMLILVEMVLVSLLAQNAYKVPVQIMQDD